MRARTLLPLLLAAGVLPLRAAPALNASNVNVAAPNIRIWNVKATSAQREGSSTGNEAGKVRLNYRDGSSSTHDATLRVQRPTIFQDGEICHNYGSQCYCSTTTYRFESTATKWKFSIPSNNQPVACPVGIKPTGDADIRKSMSREDLEAKKRQILEERRAAQRH